MARRKNKGNEKGQAIAKLIMEQYQPQNKDEMQEAIKDVFGPMLEAMLQGEMDNHLGYTSNDHGSKDTDNRRNGYIERPSEAVSAKFPLVSLVTEMAPLSPRLFLSVQRILRVSRIKSFPCMAEV